MNIGFFISPHGFGHAARACAVMAALRKIDPALHFEIFTRVPRWFFDDSLRGAFAYHSLLTDIGLVQETALREDVRRTVESLNRFLPFDSQRIDRLARRVKHLNCELIVCDIAPLGLAVGKAARIPSVLVENFTWDWIYQAYARTDSCIKDHAAYFGKIFRAADYHIQTEPICLRRSADLRTTPVSREPRVSRAQTRAKLGIPRRTKAMLITMGGIPGQYEFLHRLESQRGVHFVIPGSGGSARTRGNVILLPHRSEFYHPDLVNACDAVISKLGYSTVAEAYHAGVPLAYIARPSFRESGVVARFVQKQMQGMEISQAEFQNGSWLDRLPDLLGLPRIRRRETNGAQQVAIYIADLLK